MRKYLIAVFILSLCVGCGSAPDSSRTEHWRKLVRDLVDLERVARIDSADTHLLSSVDPTGGNDDFNHYVRKGPDGWWVLADLEGPGYISRFWTTGTRENGLRFYFDDERRPSIDTTLGEFVSFGSVFRKPLSMHEQGCWYSFVPIPYSRRLVIMAEEAGTKQGNWPRMFYQINSSKLPQGEKKYAMPSKLCSEDEKALADVERIWRDGDFDDALPEREIVVFDVVVEPNMTTGIKPLNGPCVIRKVTITPDFSLVPSAVAREKLLRDVSLEITWDDSAQKSVDVPLGDFFGSFWRRREFNSAFIGMNEDTFFTRFPMPFQRQARLSFANRSGHRFKLSVQIEKSSLATWDEQWGYFHSCWNRTTPADIGKPHTVVKTSGKGKYVGCVLSVASTDRSWWILEGDETIRVDGEMSPGWKGTGLEDYFNGGWYYRNVMSRPLHGLLYKSPFATIQYRFHLVDSVNFNTSLDMQFERGPGHASKGWMESVAYYYLSEPSGSATDMRGHQDMSIPHDPLEDVALMLQIFNAERLDGFTASRHHIEEYLDRKPAVASSELLKLRAIACEEEVSGIEAVRSKYEAFVKASSDSKAVQQAKTLLWFHEDLRNVLLGAYCNGLTKVYIDGKQVCQVDHPELLLVRPLQLDAGRHVIAVESAWTRFPAWVQVYLRTHGGDVVTSLSWKWSHVYGGEWKNLSYDDSGWQTITTVTKDLPEEPFLKAQPNGFAGMQSKGIGMTTPVWNKNKNTVYFRKVFDIQP